MKNKKLLKLLCCTLVCTSLISNVGFAYTENALNATDSLNKLGLFQGTGQGYELDKSLTRAEAVTMIVRLLGEEKDLKKENHPFVDVPEWADKYIGYAYKNDITKGIDLDKFGSNDAVTLQQFLTFVLRVLEYKDPTDFVWDASESLSLKVGLMTGVDTETFLRGDMVEICKNALTSKYKGTELPLYKMLVEKGVFTTNEYKKAFGITTDRIFSSGGGSRTSSSSSDTSKDIVPTHNYKISLANGPKYDEKSENCFKMEGEVSEDGKAISVKLILDGKVNLCGFDMILKYNPEDLKLSELDDGLDLQIYSANNEKEGKISFNYSGATNLTKSKEILIASFEVVSTTESTDTISMDAVEVIKVIDKDNEIENAECTLNEIKYSIN